MNHKDKNHHDHVKVNFAGNYTSTGKTYFQNVTSGTLIKVCTRLHHNQIKPKLYVMAYLEAKEQKFLTSLYPLAEPNTYRAEIERQYFTVFYDGAAFRVLPINSKC